MDIWEKLQSVEQNFFTIEQQLQSTGRALPDPIFIINEFGKFMEIIGGQERSPYRSVEFLVGKYINEVLPESLADSFMHKISEAIEKNTLKTIEYQLGPGDITGSPPDAPKGNQWFESRIYPIKDKTQEVHSVIWLSLNITKRKNLEKQLKDISERDGLTGAYNRKFFMQIFDYEFLVALRYKTKLSVLLIDIDNLKEINDTYGLDCGDGVMKEFTSFCQNNIRKSDLLARYSIEKFIVMLPNTPSIGAAIIAERIRAGVEEMSLQFKDHAVQFTISIGAGLILDADTTSTAVISRADAALYQAKKNGRNRIEFS